MKKIFAIAIIGLALASCKKSSSGLGSNAIQATIGGNTATFNVLTTGFVTDSGKTITLSAGDGTNATTANSFTITINGDKAITTGTYSDTTTAAFPFPAHATSSFSWDEATTVPNASNTWTSIGLISSPITIAVTSITSTEIKGTFQGKVYLEEFGSADSTHFQHAVTNGKFDVNLTKKY